MTVHDESVVCVAQLKPVCLDINSHVDEIFIELRQRDPGRYKMMTGGDSYTYLWAGQHNRNSGLSSWKSKQEVVRV